MGIGAGTSPQHECHTISIGQLWVGENKVTKVRRTQDTHGYSFQRDMIKCFHEAPVLDHIIFPGHSQDRSLGQ